MMHVTRGCVCWAACLQHDVQCCITYRYVISNWAQKMTATEKFQCVIQKERKRTRQEKLKKKVISEHITILVFSTHFLHRLRSLDCLHPKGEVSKHLRNVGNYQSKHRKIAEDLNIHHRHYNLKRGKINVNVQLQAQRERDAKEYYSRGNPSLDRYLQAKGWPSSTDPQHAPKIIN